MSCINCGADEHDAVECPELEDALETPVDGDTRVERDLVDGVDRVVDKEYGHVVYVAYGEDGTVTSVDVADLPRSDPGGIDDMIQALEGMKAGEHASTVQSIDDRIAALRSLETSLGDRE